MSRLALFSPWPPQPSGVASCSADVVSGLAASGHSIDVFVDEALLPVDRAGPHAPRPGELRVIGAHDFVWRQARGQYDLPIYQLGNSWAHGFEWPYLFRWPGLVVLHDAQLHHARASTLLGRKRFEDYRTEFRFNHPGVAPGAAELAVNGFDGAYYYQWPMQRAVIESARLVAAHSRGVVEMIRAAYPHSAVDHIRLGHGRADLDTPAARQRFRHAHGIAESAVVFGVVGTASLEKRIGPIIRAFAAARQWTPDARLLFAGAVDPVLHLTDLLASFGVSDAAHVVGRLDDGAFDDAVAACDVGLCLRWPSAREVSGPWLRFLAAGRPTVIVDAVHHLEVSCLDARTWRCHQPTPDLAPNPEERAVAVAIDILDEDHSLRLAMRRLATDAELRAQIGATARRYWESNHTVSAMVADYERVIARAVSTPLNACSLPEHLRPDPLAHARTLTSGMMDLPF